MRLRGIRRSRNVEFRGGGRAGKAGGIGIVGLLVILGIGWITGIDVRPLLGLAQTGGSSLEASAPVDPDSPEADFAVRVLATTEDVWGRIFPQQLGRDYTPPQLVLFDGVTRSPCGNASGATGPFYCPADRKAYLDLAFFETMSRRLGAEGDFAAAYVIAHEVAHHVQNEIGLLSEVHAARQSASQVESNALTVRLELMADCFSGIWARNVEGLMERGDLEEALNAARMIGDDHLQRSAGKVPQPHTYTHGTSAQRSGWFKRGWDSGDMQACDTFATDRL